MQAVLCLSQTNIIFILLTKLWDPCTRKFQSFLEETLWLKSPWQCCFKQLEEEVLVVSFNIDIVASIINSKPLWSHIWIFTNLILSEGIRKADTLYLSFVFLSKSTFSFSSGNLVFKIPSCLQIQTMEIECFLRTFQLGYSVGQLGKWNLFKVNPKLFYTHYIQQQLSIGTGSMAPNKRQMTLGVFPFTVSCPLLLLYTAQLIIP